MSALSQIEIPKGHHCLRILDNTGDSVTMFDPNVDEQVADAMAKFDESMAKGMKAFVLDDGSGGGHVTSTFEKEAVHVLVQPQYVGG